MSKVLLVYPANNIDNPGIDLDDEYIGDMPFGLMSLASFLENKGHSVKIIDARAYPKKDGFDKVEREIFGIDCIGISLLTIQIGYASKLIDFIRERDKDIPIVLGGIHPTLFPAQTIQEPNIDYVIRGEGEYSMLKLLDYLATGKPSKESISGLVYEENGYVKINEEELPLEVEALPDPAYHLMDVERYVNKKLSAGEKVRSLGILTSRGCPYRCAFCTNKILTARKWRPFSANRILELMDSLIRKYKLNHFMFVDDYFFGNKKRVERIITEIKQRGYDIKWEANIRVSDFKPERVDDDFLRLMKSSGCVCLRMGAESGSDRILKLLKKDINTEETKYAIEQCQKHGITPLLYFMTGIPGETVEEAKQTYSLIFKLLEINPKTRIIVPALFRPYPGGELYNKCLDAGFKEPKTFREWANAGLDAHYLDAKNLPWIENPELIKDLQNYFIMHNAGLQRVKPIYHPFLKIIGSLAKFRFENDFWHFRVEPHLVNYSKSVLKDRWRR